MKILFISLIDFSSLDNRGIYTDLLRKFIKNNHELCIVSPTERRKKENTHIIYGNGYKILKIKIGNIQKTNFIEKGISTIFIEKAFIRGIKKYFHNDSFDLVLYATPPVTLQRVISYVKRRDGAKTYLLLKDIWPQGIVDLQILTKTGIKGIIYRYFRNKEKLLYKNSDYIGCMSQANVDYILKHNPEIDADMVEICPNSIEPISRSNSESDSINIKNKYGIPLDKVVFIYGGNLGIPQGINFLMKCLKTNEDNKKGFFIIAGSGTEYTKLKNFINSNNLTNVKLFEQLPKEDYEMLANSCDVGLIYLDNRFTIPNFPSRILSYMQSSMPILAATDINSDIGQVIESGEYGYWCESGNIDEFNKKLLLLCDSERRKTMGDNARKYLEDNYTVKVSYEIIIDHFEKRKKHV